MSGKRDRHDVPKRDWSCTGIIDLEEPSQTCEMCERQTIRYVHVMEHAEWDDELECGCVCAAHMSGTDPEYLKHLERHVSRALKILDILLSIPWSIRRNTARVHRFKKKLIVRRSWDDKEGLEFSYRVSPPLDIPASLSDVDRGGDYRYPDMHEALKEMARALALDPGVIAR